MEVASALMSFPDLAGAQTFFRGSEAGSPRPDADPPH
jgi:hypothetical protein